MNIILELVKDNYFIWIVFLLTILYLVLTKNHSFWSSRNVKFIPPVPLFGNSFRVAFSLAPNHQIQQEHYNYFSGQPYGGIWSFWKPKLMVRDPKLIEHIMIKDFSYFMNRETTIDVKTDPLANHLVNVTGDTWKNLRNKLTPVFSSGKLKTMLEQILDCSDVLVKYIEDKTATGTPLEVRDEIAGYTTDVIGSCAFGLNLQSTCNPNSQFRKIGRSIFSPSKKLKLRLAMRAQFGVLLRFLKWGRMSKELGNYFIDVVQNTVKYRQENNVKRNDFIQLLMEIRKDEEQQIKEGKATELLMNDNTMAANSFVFLLAGFETTGTTLSYMLYELSQNTDVQEKVYNEVVQTLKKYNGEISWDALKDMTYVEQVILETLRKYPPVTAVARQSVKPYRFPNSDLELPAGSVVVLPVYAIHHDPEYYPEPEKFSPERFSEVNKEKLVKNTFLAFGEGPRICIGLRFAKVEMKIAIIKLILKFKFSLNPKTITPLKYSAETIFLTPIGGLWINFHPRLN